VVAEPGFVGVAPGSGVSRWPPVSVCHQVSTMGAIPLADDVVVPVPGLGVDRLAHGAEQFQVGQVVLGDELLALSHQRADGGRGGVELVHLVLFAHGPEAARIRVGRHALEHQRRGAVRQRPVDDVAVARDPAHVRGAPEDIALVVVEDIFVGHRGVDEVAAGGVHHALGLPVEPEV
jgi:hypothetical protein